MSQTAYRTEHLATVPAGYRVRTVTRGGHRVRIAFPPGRRVKGSGQVVEVLHPLHENPCRLSNPAELLVMTNPTYSEVQGSRSRVFFESGRWTATKFAAGLGNIYASGATKGEAQRKLRAEIRAAKERGTWRNPAELLVMTNGRPNPEAGSGERFARLESEFAHRRGKRAVRSPGALAASIGRKKYGARQFQEMAAEGRRHNPDAAERASELYQDFHGAPAQHVDEYREPSSGGVTLTELGPLVELQVKCDAGWKLRKMNFKGAGVQVAANPAGTQIYFVGGNQRGPLACFGVDRSKELLDLGDCTYIAYRASKAHDPRTNGIATDYEHNFGEETGALPRLMYDKRGEQPRLFLVGGAYQVKPEGIVN